MRGVSEYIVPSLIFFFTSLVLLLSRILVLDLIWRWAKGRSWPAYIAVGAIWHPTLILSLLISTLLAIITLPLDITWKSTLSNLLWSLFIVVITVAVLIFTKRIANYYRGQMTLPSVLPVIRNIIAATTITIASLIAAGVWGVPTTPLIVLILVLFVVLILVARDAGPEYFAALHLRIREQIRIGEAIRLQDGEQGIVSSMGWHSVGIITPEGKLLIIPNSTLTKQIVIKFQWDAEAVKTSLDFFEKQTLSDLDVKHKQLSEELASTLSRREMEIAKLVSQGATNKELAKTLFITENTVKVHVKNILRKLEIKNRQQLAVLTASQPPTKKG